MTTTTQKTLRGPRGALILCKSEFASAIDRVIFPGTQAGPLMHVIAAKAVAFKEAMAPEFQEYQQQILRTPVPSPPRSRNEGYHSSPAAPTTTSCSSVDLSEKNITGKEAEQSLERSGVMLNKNLIPFDKRGPSVTSGIRIGTPAVTTRGMKEPEMELVGRYRLDGPSRTSRTRVRSATPAKR